MRKQRSLASPQSINSDILAGVDGAAYIPRAPVDQALYVLGLTSGSYEAIQSISAVINYEGLLHWVQSRPDIQLYGDTYSDRSFKVPVISFQVSRRSPANSVGQIWAKTNCTSTADSYWARSLLEDVMCMDIDDGLIQSPFVHYSTINEAQ
ncbi:hypothetical protein CEP51_008480 [Fusarium floridanum]|uniref:Uncharacterized protein n=1 Tax=Fusarium floridanum TaxID=1325733 RepID=A0A428RKR7_9HYPO|nr:hypothetical protein CEP51_008480 [Fusarium floridanum]